MMTGFVPSSVHCFTIELKVVFQKRFKFFIDTVYLQMCKMFFFWYCSILAHERIMIKMTKLIFLRVFILMKSQ